MSWDVLVVSTPSRDSDLAVFVTFDQARFLFNCPEGTQRQFVQKRLSMRKLKAVFFTDDDTRAVAGLPGELRLLTRVVCRVVVDRRLVQASCFQLQMLESDISTSLAPKH